MITTTVTIENKNFEIKKFSAWEYVDFVFKILAILSADEHINPALIKQFIFAQNNLGDTGEVSQEEAIKYVSEQFNSNKFDFFFYLIKSAILGLEYKNQEIVERLLNCAYIVDPMGKRRLSITDPNPDHHIDLFLKDGMSLFKLLAKIVAFNFGSVFGEIFSPSPKP